LLSCGLGYNAPMSEGPANRIRFQYSLRTLLVSFVIGCAVLGWIAAKIARDHQRTYFWSSLMSKKAVMETETCAEAFVSIVLRDGSYTDDDVRNFRHFYPATVVYHRSSKENRKDGFRVVRYPVLLPEDAPFPKTSD
jgi:hypothetical protein